MAGFLCRSFLYGVNRTEAHGLDRFLDVLEERKDEKARTRGLITGMLPQLSVPSAFGVAS